MAETEQQLSGGRRGGGGGGGGSDSNTAGRLTRWWPIQGAIQDSLDHYSFIHSLEVDRRQEKGRKRRNTVPTSDTVPYCLRSLSAESILLLQLNWPLVYCNFINARLRKN